jgi:metal-sulfur cluster biosynthetic enzyme
MINEMLHSIEACLNELPELDIEINVVFEPLWNPEMMSQRAKIKMGLI